MTTETRKNGWNTYMPWLFALSVTLSVILVFVVVVSWMPSPEIEGVPPEAQSAPLVPGGLGLLMLVIAGRQFVLRSEARK
jgi:hypothetical protein